MANDSPSSGPSIARSGPVTPSSASNVSNAAVWTTTELAIDFAPETCPTRTSPSVALCVAANASACANLSTGGTARDVTDLIHPSVAAMCERAARVIGLDVCGIDLILAAHDKYYERSTITGGIVHVITNIGEVAPNIPGGNHPDCTAIKTDRSTQSTAFVTMDGDRMSGRVVDETGAELDTFSIQK